MTTPNQIVFQATGQPAKDGEYVLSSGGMLAVDSLGTQSVRHNNPAYRRIDSPALEVAEAVASARALIAACEGAAQ